MEKEIANTGRGTAHRTQRGPSAFRHESFVLREGTDYGEREISLADKVGRVIRQLEHGEAQIVFDPQTESVDIVAVRRR